MILFADIVCIQGVTVKVKLVNATATFVKMVDNVTRGATTPDTTASVQNSGQETSVKQG